MTTIDIVPSDVIKIIQQYLKENGLTRSLKALQDETKVKLNNVDSIDTFVSNIKSGNWHEVLRDVRSLEIPDSKLVDLYEQVVIETIELGDTSSARQMIQNVAPIAMLKLISPDRYNHLHKLLDSKSYTKPYKDGSTKERRRVAIADELKKEVCVYPPHRLAILLDDALKWIRHDKMLPDDAIIDVFTNKPSPESQETDGERQQNCPKCRRQKTN